MIRHCLLIAASSLALAACGGEADPPDNEVMAENTPVPTEADASGATPMAERVAVIALLNKRNGIVRDFTLKPGQAFRAKDVIIRLRACEATAPWESERLTGAFVQVDVQRTDNNWGRVFSGWLYKESPSLNVVEHPVYDVWPKSCTMSWPSAPGMAPSASDSSSPSRRSNSGGSRTSGSTPSNSAQEAPSATPEPATPPVVPSAPESNST